MRRLVQWRSLYLHMVLFYQNYEHLCKERSTILYYHYCTIWYQHVSQHVINMLARYKEVTNGRDEARDNR
jgi:hypothetical protein